VDGPQSQYGCFSAEKYGLPVYLYSDWQALTVLILFFVRRGRMIHGHLPLSGIIFCLQYLEDGFVFLFR
jgi:hypothetical protein